MKSFSLFIISCLFVSSFYFSACEQAPDVVPLAAGEVDMSGIYTGTFRYYVFREDWYHNDGRREHFYSVADTATDELEIRRIDKRRYAIERWETACASELSCCFPVCPGLVLRLDEEYTETISRFNADYDNNGTIRFDPETGEVSIYLSSSDLYYTDVLHSDPLNPIVLYRERNHRKYHFSANK